MSITIPIENIEDGMVLSEPILNNYGQTLMQSGVNLSEKHKKILKTWNVRLVTVKSDDNEEEFQISPELKILAEERLSKRLKWKPRNSIERDFYQMGIIHTAKMKLKQKKGI
jgi:hypothetical protein